MRVSTKGQELLDLMVVSPSFADVMESLRARGVSFRPDSTSTPEEKIAGMKELIPTIADNPYLKVIYEGLLKGYQRELNV